MRLTKLAMVAIITTGCGGDETDDGDALPTQRPVSEQPAADTIFGDTIAAGADSVGVAARPGQSDTAGRTPTSSEAEQPGRREQSEQSEQSEQRSRLYTVQVAAFTDAASATGWAERLRSQGMPVWTSVAEVGGETFHRLRVGAVPTVDEARRLGGMLAARYEWPVWVAPLTAADRPPENAVAATRRLIESG